LLKFFPPISHYSQNTQKEWRIRKKKFLLSTMPDDVKGKVFRGNQMGDHKLAYDEQVTNLIFFGLSLTLKGSLRI
jgi:hypothetical protein